ncbi:DNase I-like protein [Pluteus cervinus]|uniref:DNase I-like protein n=1 Tax=Pluteus cervinus TaxID=181527 RepID=A0ACD3BE83_9AGAR|nr:DNase I-like protein [Pluteus cervinus]
MSDTGPERLLVQIASYNTNLQGIFGLPQDLVDWLSPTLEVSTFLSPTRRAPDVVVVGFQELLPLHLGLAGLSKAVIDNRDSLILSQIETHAPNKERYSLVAKVVNVGVALFVYARDDGLARDICNIETQWTGCGPLYMGNKGAVAVRFRTSDQATQYPGEIFTFVCAHLTAHDHKVAQRVADYNHIAQTLLFGPVEPTSRAPSTMFSTTHLFYFGDLNFRLQFPETHPMSVICRTKEFAGALDDEIKREEIKDCDQLVNVMKDGRAFADFHEGQFWKFKCSYKYQLGEVDKYSSKRIPSWTDRILYMTSKDAPGASRGDSAITNLLYTSIPSYTTSDHKPIVSLLLMPSSTDGTASLITAGRHSVDRHANFKRYSGRLVGRVVGVFWWLLTFLGAGSTTVGTINFLLGLGAWRWWGSAPSSSSV